MEDLYGFEELLEGLKTEEMKDGLTIEELMLKTGKSDDWLKTKLKLIQAAGRLVIGRKKQRNLQGRMIMVPSYKIVSAPKGTEKKR